MANIIICTDSVIAETSIISGLMRFEKALALVDENGKPIQAVFSIDTDADTVPMVGITMYGRVTGQYEAEADSAKEVTITATPLDTTIDPVSEEVTLEDLFQIDCGGQIGGIG